jgi:crotonobetainyl-CoA:carnitine CoA-transferase CaiB-like acyl-CoA transferase
VRDLGELFADPQVEARDMLAHLDHATLGRLQQTGTPLKLSATPGGPRSAPPLLGAHTESVLVNDLGLTGADVETLRTQGIV